LVSEEDVSTANGMNYPAASGGEYNPKRFNNLVQNSLSIQASGSWHCPLIIMPAGSPSIELFKGVPHFPH